MSDTSPRLSMPYIAPAQAQKHVTHNEALVVLDALVQSGAASFDLSSPPANVSTGALYVVAASATGDWAGQENNLAFHQNGGWMFLAPQEGWRVWNVATEQLMVYVGGTWAPLLGNIDQVDGLGINAAWDQTNRLVVGSDATLFTGPTAGHQLKVNKVATGDTASLLFQTGYTGHAEMGLAGDNNFSVKVSPDGNTWANAIEVDAATAAVSVPALTLPSGDVQAALDELANRMYGRENVTIINGEITIGTSRHIVISSETAGVADSLEKINGGYDGQIITCSEAWGSGNITYESDVSGGNIQLADNTSQTLTQSRDSISLYLTDSKWRVISIER